MNDDIISKKILEKHLPTLENDIKDLKDKTMSPSVADKTKAEALKILEMNYDGEKLELMKEQLNKVMKTMQENFGEEL